MLIQGSLTDEEIQTMFGNAQKNTVCTELEIRDIDFDERLVGRLIETLASKSWDRIQLSNARGGSIVNDVVVACFLSSQKVEKIELVQSRSIDSQSFYTIAYALKYHAKLRHLRLSVETIDYEGGNMLGRALAQNTWLSTLDLAGTAISAQAVSPLSFALRINRTIEKLVLDGCRLEDSEIATLLMALQGHPALRILSLQQTSCHSEGMGAIAAILHYNDLHELDLSYLIRQKGDSKQEHHKGSLKSTPGSYESDEETKPGQVGCKSSSPEEQQSGGVEEVDSEVNAGPKAELKANEIQPENDVNQPDDESNENRRVTNFKLRSFQVAGNSLSDQSISSLLRIFGTGSALEELNLFGNRISDDGLHLILTKIPTLTHLRTLWLGQNLFTSVGAHNLLQVMETNYSLENVSILSFGGVLDEIQAQIDYYARLNRGGRRIFGECRRIPLSVWPLIMSRTSRMDWSTRRGIAMDSTRYAADALFCLVRGPALFENPALLERL